MDSQVDYSSTVNLPKTEFPQKANLPEREPPRVEKWQKQDITGRIDARHDRPNYVLHDGPPYANGDIHIGHTLNKVLKDLIVRYKTMKGFRAHYVHGSDCHGLPIEQKVVDKLREEKTYAQKTPLEIRQLCAEYAAKWVKTQHSQFQRLGIGGEYEHSYITMDPGYEAALLRGFRKLVDKNLIYKGLKVIHWDPIFETALAEAEIEYNEDHISPSIYVKFPFKSKPPVAELQNGASIVIWTTTPWTLPANLGVSVHPEFDYVAYRVNGDTLVVARALLDEFVQETGLAGGEVIAEFKGTALDRQVAAHPLTEGKDSLLMLGTHVTLEQGTGAVHTAPGHGVEDFAIGKEYGLEAFNPVDEKGQFSALYPEMQGTNVFKANPVIIEKLKAKGILLAQKDYKHKYPYSWRSRKPVIMRATEQWFMRIEESGLRDQALKVCDEVQWIPSWGRDRIYNMLASRPDWCLSRQRAWGIPIPSIIDRRTNKGILNGELIDNFIKIVEAEGSDAWYRRPLSDFLPASLQADAAHLDKEFNTFDVWYDSGSSHLAVLNEDYGLTWPADLYLEGADQHRGWFQHSLWVGLGVKGSAPFRAVLTHGFVLDEQKRPMSKSLGNVISPLDVIKNSGADVLRLWVTSEDYRGDISISKNAVAQMSEAYRKIRNTLRAVMGNLFDFDPAKDRVPYAQLGEVDRWALAALNDLTRRVGEAYEKFEFHRVYHDVNNFCVRELSSLYVDMTKDRLYCSAPNDPIRRGSQTVFYEIASVLTRLIAPILVFTADEAWELITGDKDACVHLTEFPEPKKEWMDAALLEKWERLLALRVEITKRIEPLRRDKIVGSSLEATVRISSSDAQTLGFLRANTDVLPTLFIVSQVIIDENAGLTVVEELAAQGLKLGLDVGKSENDKCPRCWRRVVVQKESSQANDLCDRCADVMRRMN
ncbi:MAG: isoleucine--tRNA ligase [Candidatus Sumerlaeota bacterium]